MKITKAICAVLCGTMLISMLGGCGDKVDKNDYIARIKEDSASESEAQADDSQADDQNSQVVEEKNLTPANWTDMKFTLDGSEFVLDKMPYSTLSSIGWTYDPVIYGMDVISFEPGTVYDRSVYLVNANYDDTSLKVGFTNFGDTACTYDANHVWSVEFSAFDKVSYPNVSVGGITWGYNEEDIKTVFGEPSWVITADDGSTEFAYGDGGMNALKFYLYNGVVERIVLESFD